MGHQEQLNQHPKTRNGAHFRKWCKNQFNRWIRRAGKLDPEDGARKQGHHGYEL